MMTRRNALKITAGVTAACAINLKHGTAVAQGSTGAPNPPGPFKLPPLPYAVDALEPNIDAQTMQIHHDRHHGTYVTNLNKAVADAPELNGKSIEALLKDLNSVPEKVR